MAGAKYSEDNNVQEPAAKFLAEHLDWRSVYAFQDEGYGLDSLLGRKDATEVVLTRELDKALARLNPKLAKDKLIAARDRLLDADPTKTLLQHNEEKWRLIRDGITLKSLGDKAEDDVHVRVIDFENPNANDFLAVRELWIKSGSYTKRCDIIGFVNGIPLVFIELKRHDKGLKAAFEDISNQRYLFLFFAFLIRLPCNSLLCKYQNTGFFHPRNRLGAIALQYHFPLRIFKFQTQMEISCR